MTFYSCVFVSFIWSDVHYDRWKLMSSCDKIFIFLSTLGWMASFRQAEDKSRYFKNTPYLHRCLRAKQLLRASELMRAAYHEKEVQFNPIKDNQRPTATRDEYLLLLWWLNGSTEGLRLQVFSARKMENSSTCSDIVPINVLSQTSFLLGSCIWNISFPMWYCYQCFISSLIIEYNKEAAICYKSYYLILSGYYAIKKKKLIRHYWLSGVTRVFVWFPYVSFILEKVPWKHLKQVEKVEDTLCPNETVF